MRTAVVVGVLALLWSAADARPKKRPRGTFADCIETSAPDKPTRRPSPRTQRDEGPTSVVIFVVDRSVDDLKAVKDLVIASTKLLHRTDIIAVVAFDSEARIYVRPTRATNREWIANDIFRMQESYSSNLFVGLKESFELSMGINATTKMVIVLTDGRVALDGISELLDDMYRARARVVVAGTHGGVREELTKMAGWGHGKLIMLDDRPGDQQLFDELRAIARPQSRTPVTSRRRSSTPRTPDRSR